MARASAPGTCGRMAVPLLCLPTCLSVCLLLCLLVGVGPLASSRAVAGSGGGELRIGLEGAAFKDFLVFMGQLSGKNPVFRLDQLPDAVVTLVAPQGVAPSELDGLRDLVLGVAGLTAIARAEVVYLLPEKDHAPRFAGPTQILAQRLGQGLAPAQVADVLERLRSDEGLVATAANGGWVVIRDRAERVARARVALQALAGAPAGSEVELAPLRRAEARLAARKLDMHFKGLPGQAPVVQALDWSNSVLLAGGAAQVDQARRLLAKMDEGGREAPALRAFRLRYAKAPKVADVLRGLAASDKRLEGLRVRVDAEAGAVVVLAEPELMARVERLVADLDQPRPRVLVEALVLELPVAKGRDEVLAVFSPAGAGATVLANPPQDAPAGAVGFARAAVGAGVSLHGQAFGAGAKEPAALPGGPVDLDALAERLLREQELRVLARPRAAVPDGGEMRLGITRPDPAGGGPGVERQRLVFTPLQDAEGGQVSLRVSLEDAEAAARFQVAEARLVPGQMLLLEARGHDGQASASGSGGGPQRLAVLLAARVVRNAAPAAGASRGLGETKP